MEVTEYVGTVMAKDIIEIMDHEAIIGEVVGIAHDWGTYLLSTVTSSNFDPLEIAKHEISI